MGRVAIGVGAALAAWGAATPAAAGAWIAPEEGQSIATISLGWREEAAFTESDHYLELPLSDRTAFVATPHIRTEGPEAETEGDVALGLKMAFLRASDAAAALQAAALWRSDPDPGCQEGGGELRALGGLSQGQTFYNVEAALRLQSGGCMNSRLDLTFGYRPGDDWLVLGQAFLDDGAWGEPSIKAQASIVAFGDDRGGLQFGVRVRLDGDDPEPALVLGWWQAAAW